MSRTDSTEFTKEKIADVLKECQNIPGLKSFTSNEVTIEDDPMFRMGNCSAIVRLRADDGSTVIAKCAPSRFKGFGLDLPLSPIRTELEMVGLQLFEQYSPGYCPKPLFYSSKHNTGLIEDIAGYKTLHSELLAGNVSKFAVGKLAVHMARLHRSTHKDNISANDWAKLQELLNKYQTLNEQLATIHASYPYIKDPQDEVAKQMKQIAEDRVLHNSKLKLFPEQFLKDYVDSQECLVHGDNHTRNILVKGEDAKLIDHEFIHLGPCWVDVCKLFTDLIIAYHYHLVSPEYADSHGEIAHDIQDCSHHMMDTYIEHMSWGADADEKTDSVTKFMTNLAKSIGCRLFILLCFGAWTLLGASQVDLLEASVRLMEQYHEVDSVDKIYSILALQC